MARDLYQEVTDKIIGSLEAGTAPWIRPWKIAASAAQKAADFVLGVNPALESSENEKVAA